MNAVVTMELVPNDTSIPPMCRTENRSRRLGAVPCIVAGVATPVEYVVSVTVIVETPSAADAARTSEELQGKLEPRETPSVEPYWKIADNYVIETLVEPEGEIETFLQQVLARLEGRDWYVKGDFLADGGGWWAVWKLRGDDRLFSPIAVWAHVELIDEEAWRTDLDLGDD